jgi:PAS domain S-box-containing protein
MIIDIVRTHPVVLVGGVLRENPFYVPPDEFLAELRTRQARSGRGEAGEAQHIVAKAPQPFAEAAVRGAEERFRLAFEHAAVGMALLTPEGRFVQVNPALCGILGREETDLLATNWQSVTAPEDLRRALDAIRPLVAGEATSVIVEKRCVRPNGAVVWVQNSLSIAQDASGRPKHVVMLMEDITDQRRAEEALRVSEARFSRLFRNSPAALGMETLHCGRMIDANDQWLELFDYRRDEVIGHTTVELNLWADPGGRARMVEGLLRDGVGRDLEIRVRRKSGEIREALLSFIRAEMPGEEEPVMISMLLDVTDRRRAELERARLDSITDAALSYLGLDALLRELLGRLRSALRAEVASVWLVDGDAQVLALRAVDGVPFERIADVRIPIDSSEPLTLDAGGSDDWFARVWSLVGLPLRAGMGVPLVVEAKAIGVLNVASARSPFTPEDQRLLQVVADRAAPAIERERLVETVGESRRRLAALSQRLVEVQETERREIARELHDEIGQFLTGLLFKIEGRGAGAGSQKDEMKGIVHDLIDRVRDLSMKLRPSMLDDLGLLPALKWQIHRFETQTGIYVRFNHADLDRRFGGQVEITAYRIVQEALTNVARHARVRQAKVDVRANPDSLIVRIEDEGRGFDVEAALAARSSGLEGMRERSRLAGGRLVIESEPGQGTRLSVELPLQGAGNSSAMP